MRFLLVSILIASCFLPPSTVLAQDKSQPPKNGYDASVFVFQGTECPAGSFDYKGPEAQLIKDKNPGYLYCRFLTPTRIVKKTSADTKCPVGTKPYTHEKYKPGEGVIWCEDDPAFQRGSAGGPPPVPPVQPPAAPKP
jgi:hypothetical protein